jgi:hypothetical protein
MPVPETGGQNLLLDTLVDAASEENPRVAPEQAAVAVLCVGRGLGPLMAILVLPRQRTQQIVEVILEVIA